MIAKRDEPDVKVHITSGCDVCGRTDQHTHEQEQWREMLDAKPWPWGPT